MGLREKLVNALGGQIVRSSRPSANDFLRYGNRTEPLYPTWSQVKMSDRDMYKGYSYAAIQRRANGVADIALSYIRTSVNDKTLESFNEQQETPVHPYLKLIQESTSFTEKEFWTTISIYLDLAGRYYLGCVRKQGRANSSLPSVLSDVKKFVLLNPYEVNRVINPNTGEVSGYIEHKPDGRERIWDNYQIIELRELNPFDWTQFYSVTDAAKENIFTLKQSGDYTAKSLDGNLKTPGIIATDIQLSPEEFADFRARIVNSREGEPIFANGGGHITWEPMNVDLDKSALSSVNEMNRTELFSAMGMSKTSMGIEESGTTRETARVQNENAATKTYKPRVDFIVGCLTKDYKQKYPREFKLTGYDMYVDSVVEADYDTEIKAVQLRQAQSDLANALIQQGYTPEVSAQYVQGEIELGDLVASEKDEVQSPVEEQSQPANPLEVSAQTPIEPLQGDSGSNMGDESSTEQRGLTGGASGQEAENSIVVNNSITDELDLDNYNPADLDEKQANELNEAYEKFLTNVRKVERQIINESSSQLIQNNFTESDFLDGEKKESFVDRLVNFYKQYWWIAFPLFANILTNKRNNEFGARHEFVVTNDIENTLDQTAKEVSEGHVNTIVKDVILTANKVYDELTTNEAVKLIKQDYAEHPNNYLEYFVTTPTDKEILNAIKNTDILSQNERIYRTARQLALQGGSRQNIAKAIRERYQHISETRATTIARNETSRIFTQSQYDADFQFLNSIGKLSSAKKRLVSRTGHPCEICQAIIDQGPIPFTQNFLDKGQSIEVGDKTFTANYEAIGSGVVHVNCYSKDTSVYTDKGWKLFSELDGSEKFWSINPDTKKPEWVNAINWIKGHSDKMIRFKNKNVDLMVTPDHNMVVMKPKKLKNGTRFYNKLSFVPAKDVKGTYNLTAEVNWDGKEPSKIKLGDYELEPEMFCKFMGYYLSEGSSNTYKSKGKYQTNIAQRKHHDLFWNDLKKLPFKVWNGKFEFTIPDQSVGKYCSQFGKSYEKFIPDEIKELSPRLLRIFLDAYILGDGSVQKSDYSGGISRSIFTSSTKMRDDLTEVVAKAGFRPTVSLFNKKNSPYQGTEYRTNWDVWRISICNKLRSNVGTVDVREVDYDDDVYCVELEKYHTLFVQRNGKCWWSGNCNCRYELVFDNETFNALETKNLNLWVDAHSEDECCVCNASKGNPYHDVRDGKFTFAPFSSKAYSSAVKSAQNKMKKDYLAQAEKEGTTDGMSEDEISQMVDDEYSMYEPEDFPDADMMNSYIAREAGFNKEGATKLTREDFDTLEGQTYYRGVIAKSPADVDAQMKDWRLPDGEGGAGIYASTNRSDIESYVNPSDIPDGYKGYVIEMKIPANEQIHNYHEDNKTASDSYEGDFGRSQLDGSIALKHEVVSYGQDGAMTDAVCIKNKDIISYVVNEEENE